MSGVPANDLAVVESNNIDKFMPSEDEINQAV
jgi:hypothetical protein